MKCYLPTVKKAFFCCHLKVGAVTIGWINFMLSAFYIAAAVIGLLYYTQIDVNEPSHITLRCDEWFKLAWELKFQYIMVILFAIINMVAAIFLLYGALIGSRGLLIPSLVILPLIIVTLTASAIIGYLTLFRSYSKYSLSQFFVTIVHIVYCVYCEIAVFAFYKWLYNRSVEIKFQDNASTDNSTMDE